MSPISRMRALALGLSVVCLATGGCGYSGDLGPPPLVLNKAPTGSGDQQTGPVGTALANALRVIVTRDGVPESGVSVNWSVTVGSVDPASTATRADGIGATTWTLGAAEGAQTAQAVVSGATDSPVSFAATATAVEPIPPAPPPPVSPLALAKAPTESGDAQTGPVGSTLAKPLQVIVTRDGAAQSSVTVVWTTGDGSLDPGSTTTGADGVASSSWTLGSTAGLQMASAEVTDATGSPVTFTATATSSAPPPPPPPPPLPPSELGVTVGNIFFRSGRNGSTNPAVDTVAVNGTVTWTWTATGTARHSVESTGSTQFASSAVLIGDGQTYSFKFTQAGTYTYDCMIHGSAMTGRIVVK